MPFKGELMQCAICEKIKRSRRSIASNWAYIQLNGCGFYACPECLKEEQSQTTKAIPTHTLNKIEQAIAAV
jgi:hypothetical protein